MKFRIQTLILTVALSIGATMNAQSLSDILGGNKTGTMQTIGNMLEGIFTKSNLTLADIVGTYESSGPAVTFKSDNFLQKAGGIAGASALETKLQPYFEKYGFIGMPLVINEDGTFNWTVKGIILSGTVEPNTEEGTFTFNLTVGKLMKLGSFKAYVEKTGNNIKLMFDAKKLKQLISTVGKVSGISIAKTLGSLLDSYDGACIGFKMTNTGKPATTGTTPVTTSDSTSSQAGSALENLFNILNNSRNR